MKLLDNGSVLLSRREFGDLLEYSTTFPTGTTPGKSWKARRPWWAPKASADWWRGTYGLPYPEGHEHHGQIPIGWRRIVVEGRPAAFPHDLTVLRPRARGIQRAAVVGVEEGDRCWRQIDANRWCPGTIELMPDRDMGGCHCSAMRMPPCSSCLSTMPECPACGWRCEE